MTSSSGDESASRHTDLEILKLVFQYRFLDVELLAHMLCGSQRKTTSYRIGKDGRRRPTQYGFGESALRKRLRHLSQAKYLTTHRTIGDQPEPGSGCIRTAYGLGTRSVPVLSRHAGVPASQLRAMVERNRVGVPYISHALGIARFRIIIKLACRTSKDRARLVFWEQGQQLKDHVYGVGPSGERERLPVYPDAFFALEIERKRIAHYFLEYDRGTMPIRSQRVRTTIERKIIAYRHYRHRKLQAKRYFHRTLPNGHVAGLHIVSQAVQPVDSQVKLAAVNGFTVLFLTPGRVRSDGLITGRIADILSLLPAFGLGFVSSLFWFTTPDQFSINAPRTLFLPIWRTARPDDPPRCLVD